MSTCFKVRRPIGRGGDASGAPAEDVPLFVDLDGTLVMTDLLFESFLSRLRSEPLAAFTGLFWRFRRRGYPKNANAEGRSLNVQNLPYNRALLDYLGEQAKAGRSIVLATASPRQLAEAVSSHLGIFSDVIATDGTPRMKGRRRLDAIRMHARGGPFDYVGSGREDLRIFAGARRAVLVGASTGVSIQAQRNANIEAAIPSEGGLRHLLAAMRPHQWLKNLLILVPLLTSISFIRLTPWFQASIGFVAFCALASSAYLLNDLLDLEADRAHPRNRRRPFAAGLVSHKVGMFAAAALAVAGFALALLLPPQFVWVAACYFCLTIVYSVSLKTLPMADVVTLAGLYTLRVVAGIAAIGAPSSFWLLAFSMFIFVSLALVKRCAEISMRLVRGDRAAVVRGYRVSDLAILQSLGVGSACVAVLILALYINSPVVAQRLQTPELLWPICVLMLYWLGRVWLRTARGEMHDDPILFAAQDGASIAVAAATAALFASAALVSLTP